MSKLHWWKGARGEWYVVIQLVLFGLVAFGPRTWWGWSDWSLPFKNFGSIVGSVLLPSGFLLLLAGIFKLGPNLTAVPYPKDGSILLQTGPFGLVRHPIYCGAILMAFGWGLLVHGWMTIAYALILLVFFDLKSRREEIWLGEKFSGYHTYQKRVRKLIPFVY